VNCNKLGWTARLEGLVNVYSLLHDNIVFIATYKQDNHVCVAQTFPKSNDKQRTGKVQCTSDDRPLRSVAEGGDVRRHVPALTGAVERRVERVQWLEHVERGRVGVEHLTDERRAAALIR